MQAPPLYPHKDRQALRLRSDIDQQLQGLTGGSGIVDAAKAQVAVRDAPNRMRESPEDSRIKKAGMGDPAVGPKRADGQQTLMLLAVLLGAAFLLRSI